VTHDLRCFDPDDSLQFLLDCSSIGEVIADLLETYLSISVTHTRCWFTACCGPSGTSL
jgi:hypothetical protein